MNNESNRRTNIKNYKPLIQEMWVELASALKDAGFSLEWDIPGSYPESTAEFEVKHSTIRNALVEVKFHVYPTRREVREKNPNAPESYLEVTYRSARGGGWRRSAPRDVAVRGTNAQIAAKLVKRAAERLEEARQVIAKANAEKQAEDARRDRFYADFKDENGKLRIPLDFAYAYTTPGEYSLDSNASEALQSDKWNKDEVLELVALLKKVRANMAADGRITKKVE